MLDSHTPTPLLSTLELARFLDIPVTTVYAWQSRGGGPPAYRVGRHTRYRRDEVLAWLEHRQLSSSDERRAGP